MNENQLLTARQQQCLDVIRQSLRTNGYPPTLREIGARMGIRSTNGVMDHLRLMVKKGVIALDGNRKSRGIRILGSNGSPLPDIRDPRPVGAAVVAEGWDVYVNGFRVVCLASVESAEGLARNLRAALAMVVE